jgi:arsenate reductase (glutaredoxin)
MSLKLYGIPSCGTVKKARAWLDAHGAAYAWHDFRQEPVSLKQVEGWVAALGAQALKNTSGGSYRALGAAKDGFTDAQWASAMAADPMLIKRPVIERDGVAVQAGFRGSDAEHTARLLG